MDGRGAQVLGGGIMANGDEGLPHLPPPKLAFLCAVSQLLNIGNELTSFKHIRGCCLVTSALDNFLT